MRKILILILSVYSTIAFSQNATNSGTLADGVRVERGEFKGTPYYTENWFTGYGILENGTKTNTYQLNYEINQDQLLYQPTVGNILALLDSDFIGFVINSAEGAILFTKSDRFTYSDKSPKMKYVRVYNPSSPSILIEYSKEIDDPNRGGWTSSSQNTLNAEFKEESNIYIKNSSGSFERIKLKSKDVLDVYSTVPNLKEYLKENKIKDMEDLVKAMDYINSNS